MLRRRETRTDYWVTRWVRSLGDLGGKVVIDIPAGAGVLTRALREQGATVEAYDLNPALFDVEGVTCRKADLSAELPISRGHADIVLCQEGIEHVPNQLGMLRELSRILKIGGRLVLTTPNVSSLRARLSHFLLESELWKRLPPSEIDAVWLAEGDETYFGHLFLVGVQRLRTLARISGLRLVALHPVKWSGTSLALGIFYPVILAVNLWAYRATTKKLAEIDAGRRREVYGEILRLNLDPRVLFGKKLFLEFEKAREPEDLAATADTRARLFEHIERQKRLAESDR